MSYVCKRAYHRQLTTGKIRLLVSLIQAFDEMSFVNKYNEIKLILVESLLEAFPLAEGDRCLSTKMTADVMQLSLGSGCAPGFPEADSARPR
ncbi:MAG: hypothetical protein B7X29_07635, partial [Halothiobacillus sp. 13-55-115]